MIVPKIETLNLPGTIAYAPEAPLSELTGESCHSPAARGADYLGVTGTSLSHRRQWRLWWQRAGGDSCCLSRALLTHCSDSSTAPTATIWRGRNGPGSRTSRSNSREGQRDLKTWMLWEAFLYRETVQALEQASCRHGHDPSLSVFRRHLDNALNSLL